MYRIRNAEELKKMNISVVKENFEYDRKDFETLLTLVDCHQKRKEREVRLKKVERWIAEKWFKDAQERRCLRKEVKNESGDFCENVES